MPLNKLSSGPFNRGLGEGEATKPPRGAGRGSDPSLGKDFPESSAERPWGPVPGWGLLMPPPASQPQWRGDGRGGDGRHGGSRTQSCGLPQTPGHISSQTDPLLSPPIQGRLCVNSLSYNKSQNKHTRDKTVPQPGQSMKYCLRGWNLPGQPLNPLWPAHGRQ